MEKPARRLLMATRPPTRETQMTRRAWVCGALAAPTMVAADLCGGYLSDLFLVWALALAALALGALWERRKERLQCPTKF